MPQNNPFLPGTLVGGTRAVPLKVDSTGNLQTHNGGAVAAYNITAATVVKAGVGRVFRVSVIVAGSAAGTLNDSATTAGAAVANEIGVIPNTVGTYFFDWPYLNGLVVAPGTGQTLAVSYT